MLRPKTWMITWTEAEVVVFLVSDVLKNERMNERISVLSIKVVNIYKYYVLLLYIDKQTTISAALAHEFIT